MTEFKIILLSEGSQKKQSNLCQKKIGIKVDASLWRRQWLLGQELEEQRDVRILLGS